MPLYKKYSVNQGRISSFVVGRAGSEYGLPVAVIKNEDIEAERNQLIKDAHLQYKEVIDFCKRKLATYKRWVAVEIRDELPKLQV